MLVKMKLMLESNKYLKKVIMFIYTSTYGKYKQHKENQNFLKNAQKVLEQADKVFKELEISYWLDFGTLLGAIRNKNFIKHDLDLDLGMFLCEYSIVHEKVFNKHGFKKIKSFTINDGTYGREDSYEYLGVSLDIFYYTRLDQNKIFCHVFTPLEGKSRDKTILELGGLVPKEFVLSFTQVGEIEFLGKQYPIPQPSEKHLIDIYGDDYMIENPSWVTTKEMNKNITILTDKIGIRKLYK